MKLVPNVFCAVWACLAGGAIGFLLTDGLKPTVVVVLAASTPGLVYNYIAGRPRGVHRQV